MFYERYSLQANPYETTPLNPLAQQAHGKLLIPVTGARLHEIDKQLQSAIEKSRGKAVFAIVKGRQSCGLTSMANYLLARFAQLNGIPPQNLIVPNVDVLHNDDFDIWLTWLASLRASIDDLPIDGGLLEKLDRALLNASEGKLHIAFALPLKNLMTELAAKQSAFAVRLENPKSEKILTTGMRILSGTPTICVFVVGEYVDGGNRVISAFNDYTGEGACISVEMKALSGQDAGSVIFERWRRSNEQVPVPFEQECLEEALKDRERPVKRIMILVSSMLAHKALIEHRSKRWPVDPELKFECEE